MLPFTKEKIKKVGYFYDKPINNFLLMFVHRLRRLNGLPEPEEVGKKAILHAIALSCYKPFGSPFLPMIRKT